METEYNFNRPADVTSQQPYSSPMQDWHQHRKMKLHGSSRSRRSEHPTISQPLLPRIKPRLEQEPSIIMEEQSLRYTSSNQNSKVN